VMSEGRLRIPLLYISEPNDRPLGTVGMLPSRDKSILTLNSTTSRWITPLSSVGFPFDFSLVTIYRDKKKKSYFKVAPKRADSDQLFRDRLSRFPHGHRTMERWYKTVCGTVVS